VLAWFCFCGVVACRLPLARLLHSQPGTMLLSVHRSLSLHTASPDFRTAWFCGVVHLQAASGKDAAKSARHNVAVSVYAQVSVSANSPHPVSSRCVPIACFCDCFFPAGCFWRGSCKVGLAGGPHRPCCAAAQLHLQVLSRTAAYLYCVMLHCLRRLLPAKMLPSQPGRRRPSTWLHCCPASCAMMLHVSVAFLAACVWQGCCFKVSLAQCTISVYATVCTRYPLAFFSVSAASFLAGCRWRGCCQVSPAQFCGLCSSTSVCLCT
jgi:hypothetical protein